MTASTSYKSGMMRITLSLACVAASLSGCAEHDDVPLLPEPEQVNIEPTRIDAGMIALAEFSAEVLVLGRREYPSDPGDVLSGSSPLDLAVAWGPAASEQAISAVELTQSDRRYHWRARSSDMDKPGVGDFTRHSGNWHMVPADEDVKRALFSIVPGDRIRMEGELVLLTFPDGTYYASSLSRNDTGDGACEIFRVASIEIIERAD